MFDENPEDTHHKASMAETAKHFEKLVKANQQAMFSEELFLQLCDYYWEKFNFKEAKNVAEHALTVYPTSLEILLFKIHILTLEFSPDEALETLEKAELFHPNDLKLAYQRAAINIIQGNVDLAIEQLEDLLEKLEDKEEVATQLGLLFSSQGRLAEGFPYLKQSVALGSENLLVFIEICNYYVEQDIVPEGIQYFNERIDADPYSQFAWYALGVLHKENDDTDQALNAYDYATTIDDQLDVAWFQIGIIKLNQNLYTEAKKAFLLANEVIEDVEYITHAAAAAEHNEEYIEAYNLYKKTTEIDPEWDDGWYGLSSVLYEQEKYLQAIHFIKKAIKLNEFRGEYQCLLGDCESKLGNPVAAHEAYQLAIELEPFMVDYWLNWSLLYFDNADYAMAYEVIKDAIEELPTEADLHYRACVYLLYDGKINQAISYLEEALILDYDGHEQLYDYFSNLETLKTIQKIIDNYRY
jgi:tetratricopeptide (TPR) repeat protein